MVEIKDEHKAKNVFFELTQNGKIYSDFQKMLFGPTITHGEDMFGVRWDVVIC